MEIPPFEHRSIFGDTMHGVPSPTIPHEHPWPTRYHGPIWNVPVFDRPYYIQTYEDEKPSGLHPAFVATPAQPQWDLKEKWLGFSGEETPPLLRSATGSIVLDAVLGAGLGYVVSKRPEDRLTWAAGGGLAALLAGTLGLVGVVGAAVYSRSGR